MCYYAGFELQILGTEALLQAEWSRKGEWKTRLPEKGIGQTYSPRRACSRIRKLEKLDQEYEGLITLFGHLIICPKDLDGLKVLVQASKPCSTRTSLAIAEWRLPLQLRWRIKHSTTTNI